LFQTFQLSGKQQIKMDNELYELASTQQWEALLSRLPTATENQMKYQNPSYHHCGVLHIVCETECVQVVKAMVDVGFDVNQPNSVRTPAVNTYFIFNVTLTQCTPQQ
jgi:hypothetical protein